VGDPRARIVFPSIASTENPALTPKGDEELTRSRPRKLIRKSDLATETPVDPSASPEQTTQAWWLSFCDSDRPTGDQFLGVAIVDVTAVDAAAVAGDVTQRMVRHGKVPTFEAVWMAAAIRKAHQTHCNPGGEVAAVRIDDNPQYPTRGAHLPRHRLLSIAEMRALGMHPVREDGEDA
jgi:hypothetical protein